METKFAFEPEVRNVKQLADHLRNIRKQTNNICKPLETEDYVVQPVADVSPPKWHLGHTTWFFETFILSKFKKNYQFFNEDFAFVFNSYYESKGKRILRTNRGNLSRPSVEEVYQYRQYVDDHLRDLLSDLSPDCSEEVLELTELGIHHEQQHQELLVTDIKYILGDNPLLPVYLKRKENKFHSTDQHPTDHLYNGELANYVVVDASMYHIGFEGEEFHYDNEEGHHQVYLNSYRILNRLVTNGEYLAFMEDGGYENYDLWLGDGWEFVNTQQIKAPMYWFKIDNQWHHYTLHGLRPVNLKAPVCHVSYYEADAFARWAGKRLPLEAEWEVASQQSGYGKNMYDVVCEANLMDSGNFQPVPRQNNGTDKIAVQMYGDVWEWTGSAYLPYPYYKRVEGALGEYNGKFMVNQMVLRGGSCATPKSHIRPTYRNFFQPDKRWQFSGFRLAEYI